METGRLFSMPTSSTNVPYRSPSIHLFVNGFSFCTPSKTEYIPTAEESEDFESIVLESFSFYPKDSFRQTQIISYYQPATFVPVKFFDKKHLSNYLTFSGKVPLNRILNFDILDSEQTVTVYTTPKRTLEFLNRHLTESTLCHYSSLLIKEVSQLSKNSDIKDQLFVHLQAGGMDLYLVENNRIRFQNHFSITNEDEFLYYIFFVVEQYKLETDTFDLVFLGHIQAYTSYYEVIKQYHTRIRFENNISGTALSTDQHPAPYLAQFS
jgi:hypothetical protein